jgi:hypothetical protein
MKGSGQAPQVQEPPKVQYVPQTTQAISAQQASAAARPKSMAARQPKAIAQPAPIVRNGLTVVEFQGFAKADLNGRYIQNPGMRLQGEHSLWHEKGQYFIYWQQQLSRWAVCDVISLPSVERSESPGWAFQNDSSHFSLSQGWMEHRGQGQGEWLEAQLVVTLHSGNSLASQTLPPSHPWGPTWNFSDFENKDLNQQYTEVPSMIIQGKPTFWCPNGQNFIYFQNKNRRWAICDTNSLHLAKKGECPGWAFRDGQGFFSDLKGWANMVNGAWKAAGNVKVFFSGTTVEFKGFAKAELNNRYTERRDMILQGKPSYWDAPGAQGMHFIYWQQPNSRWAICDRESLKMVQEGQCPGWAFRTDQEHFSCATGWLEFRDNQWQEANIQATLTDLAGPRQIEIGVTPVTQTTPPASPSMAASPEPQGAPPPQSPPPKREAPSPPGVGTFAEFEVRKDAAADVVSPYAALIQEAFVSKNPTKVNDVPRLLEKYKGKEKELYHEICKKYNLEAVTDVSADSPPAKRAKVDDDDGAKKALIDQRIQDVYAEHNKEKLGDVPRLMGKYLGKEQQLYIDICKKYGVTPKMD